MVWEDLCDEAELTTPGVYHPPHLSYTNRPSKIAELIVWLILLVWFIIGNNWVFSVFPPPARQHERSPNPTFWCNAQLYNFALLQICITHAILLTLIIAVIVLACISCRFVPTESER
uniref:Uncharacterized protein n=1 Tax=Acrobeloides nanus TaxID=290746 RepID=A0A914EIS4_9BILA